MRAVLSADLERLREWLSNKTSGTFADTYAVEGDLRRIGPGAIFRGQADLRWFVTTLDSEWFTLHRLSDAGLLDDVGGIEFENEVL